MMNEIPTRSHKRGGRRRQSRLQPSRVPTPSIDWPSIVLESLPKEPPKNIPDVFWNAYKEEFWAKQKPDSLIAFEVCRIAARDSSLPEGARILANILAALCVV